MSIPGSVRRWAMTAPPITFSIRDESPQDSAAVRAVHLAAFAGVAEADLVARLYADGDVLCGLVAEQQSVIIGHILFSRLPVETSMGEVIAAALAPLAVLPEHQRQGIGSALVRRGLELCQQRGVPAVVVLGDPDYYGRFGFRAELARGLQTPWSGPYLMAIVLSAAGEGMRSGIARYPAAFTALPMT